MASSSCSVIARSCFGLQPGQLAAPGDREVEQLVEGLPVEHRALGGALHLDEAAVAGADHVHVGAGAHVLLVGEVEARLAVDDADADRRDRLAIAVGLASFLRSPSHETASARAT